MEGVMVCCSRPKPPWMGLAPPSPTVRRAVSPVAFVGWEGRRRRHSSSCKLGTASVPSIWHAITPSSHGKGSVAALLHRRWSWSSSVEEGSWNAAWDVRPARWLHGSDSAWLLFGVCSCFNPSYTCCTYPEEAEDEGGPESGPALSPGGGTEGAFLQPFRRYKVTGILADGRCLFRAVSYGACLSSGKDAPDEMQQMKLADDLRACVADELLKRQDEVKGFIEGDFDSYVKSIQQPYVWGGEPELLMASHVLRTPLSVFMMDGSMNCLVNVANYGTEYGKNEGNSIKVLFYGYGHYDALEDITEEVPNTEAMEEENFLE